MDDLVLSSTATAAPSQQAVATSLHAWTAFLAHALAVRLDVETFAEFAPRLAARHPLGPRLIAEVLLRPPGAAGDSGGISSAGSGSGKGKTDGSFKRAVARGGNTNSSNSWGPDPRIPRYLDVLLDLRLVDVPGVLAAVWRYSTAHELADAAPGGPGALKAFGLGARPRKKAARRGKQSAGGNDADVMDLDSEGDDVPLSASPVRWRSSFAAEEGIFYRLTKSVAQGSGIRGTRDAALMATGLARWMALFAVASSSLLTAQAEDDEEDGNKHGRGQGTASGTTTAMAKAEQARHEMESARAAFIMLLLATCENPVVLRTLALPSPFAETARRALGEALAAFVPSILQASTEPIVQKLERFRTETLTSFEPVDGRAEAAKAEIDELLDSTMGLDAVVLPEVPVVNTRAGLYIYLNAALVGRPLIDDTAIFNYLHNRYQGDIQSTTIDLILASFDVLANAVFRAEGEKSTLVLRSFLMNKLPLLLVQLSTSMYPPLTAEFCITEALAQVDTNAFPTLSAMFDDSNTANAFTDSVRSDFCYACCLHGLVLESSIENLLGEMSYDSLPAGGRYVKEDLVQQCLADPERVNGLIGEIENMDGNMGAVCQALTELMARCCEGRETMMLKSICVQLAKKPLALDVMLLFDRPRTILRPLCDLLDGWKYDEDQGEYQPVYEDFGAVLLLVLAFVCRYGLSVADLGIRSPQDSFVAKLLTRGHVAVPLDELTPQQKEHLGGWIRDLFDNAEAGGLDDELMSSCTPQNFYLLVPTLFRNIVTAVATNALSEEALRGGIEYLHFPMLIPSLVMASRFLADLLRTDRPQDQKAVLKVLHPILLPKSTSSSEASGMHTAVLNMIARPLEHALRTYQKQDPRSTDVEPLLRVLRPSLPLSRRTASADHAELEAWTATSHGSLASSIRHTMQSLVLWASHPQPAINVMPASYTHRQLLAGLRMLGPRRVLGIILDELQHYSNQSGSASGGTAGNLAHAYDVATALVCAPDPATWDELLAVYHPPTPEELSSADKRPTNSRPSPSQRRLSLRETLRHAAEDWRKLDLPDSSTTPKGSGTGRPATPGKGVAGAAGSHHRRPDAAAGGRPTTAAAAPGGPAAAADASPSPRGEHALRLYRRVEAQLAPTAVLGLVAPVVGVDATAHHDILTAAAAGGANAGVGAANSVGAVDPLAGGDMSGLGGVGATDDIFADLGVLDDWGAGMDLG